MRKIAKQTAIVSALMMLFISATPSGVMPENRGRIYQKPDVNVSVDKTSVAVRELHELSKKLCKD